MTRAVQQVDRQRYMTLYSHEIIKDQQRYYSIMTNPSHVFASHLLQRTIGQTTHSNRWLLSYECVLPCGCHAYRKPSNRADNDGLMFRANRYYVQERLYIANMLHLSLRGVMSPRAVTGQCTGDSRDKVHAINTCNSTNLAVIITHSFVPSSGLVF